jgi:hypothetical protein
MTTLPHSLNAAGLDHYAVAGKPAILHGVADCFLAESHICDATSRDHEMRGC